MTRPAALFDLDGTLVESGRRIAAGLRISMAALGLPLAPDADLDWAVGPPLSDVFARLLAPSGNARIDAAMAQYRAAFNTAGLPEIAVYPGIPGALAAFRAAGWALFVATSKPRHVARRILVQVGLAAAFDAIHGAIDDVTLAHKPELVAHVLAQEGLAAARTVMIGDRSFDVFGAHANEVRAIGVLWGYGGLAELEQAGADALAERPDELPAAAGRLCRGDSFG